MGYIFDFQDTVAYDQWIKQVKCRYSTENERRLMLSMLRPSPGETVLEIGCGTGARLSDFLDSGLQVTGLDPSPYMLDIVAGRFGNRVELHRGMAEDLPFEDNSFNYACLILSLEFVDDFQKAIQEATRVAKDKIFIGFLNKHAVEVMRLRLMTIFNENIFRHARFFSISELKSHIRTLVGNVPVTCRTVSHFPASTGTFCRRIEKYRFVQRVPFGAFAGIVVVPVPRIISRPLTVVCPAKHSTGAVTG